APRRGAMKTPVSVLRLPRGPDADGRGFDPTSARFQALSAAGQPGQEQRARSELRERYLRSLLAMAGSPVRFSMYGGVRVAATFGASDVDILNFQVAELQTPLGVQRAAVLRCPDIISYSLEL
uniref:Gem (nuclear organelle) associated protein 7 n=2 Tax=Lepisosteus oculatus TaxID=7918 RepID=W5NMH1_LEPOC